MHAQLIRFVSFFCLLALTALAADSASDLRRRMEQRLPAIDRLKAAETLGENNRGLLEIRGAGGAEAAGVIADENRDREAVYALIARETGATPDSVGRARAKQIASASKAGVWIQAESGAWRKK